MYRCVARAAVMAAALVAASMPAAAQVARNFPQNALRGAIAFGQPPQIVLNKTATQLAPGSRIRGQNNLLVMSSELMGQQAVVHYTLDASGLIRDVWILRPEEIANKPWPVTPEQAQAWAFDPAAQSWTKP